MAIGMTTGIPWLDQKAEHATKALEERKAVPQVQGKASTPYAVCGYEGEINMSRVLVKAAHGLNLSQKRLIMYAVSKLHPLSKQPQQLIIKVNALEYAQEMNVLEAKNFYRDLRDATDNLFNRYISIAYETASGKKIEKIHWVSSATYHEGEGWVEIRFSPEVSPYLSMLKDGNHINYKLQLAIDLRSVYAWRLLELLMQWKDTKQLFITLESFRHALEVPESYRYTDIRINCIEKPIKELRKTAGIDINWKAIKDKKNKRRVGSLEFTWKNIEQIEMKLKGGKEDKKTKHK
jgi:plasmid replication initiation protein